MVIKYFKTYNMLGKNIAKTFTNYHITKLDM